MNHLSSESARTGLDATFSACYGRLVAWCRRRVPAGLGEPEEMVHEAYLRSRRHWLASRCSEEHGEAYFYRSLHWVIADAARQQYREAQFRARFRIAGQFAPPLHELLAKEGLERALTPSERAVCHALLAGQSEEQLSAALKVSRGALAVRACRARQKLLDYFELDGVRCLQ